MVRKYTIDELPREYYNKTYCVFEFQMRGEIPFELWLIEEGEGPVVIEGLQAYECCHDSEFDRKMRDFLESITVNLRYVNYNVKLDLDFARKHYGATVKNTIIY